MVRERKCPYNDILFLTSVLQNYNVGQYSKEAFLFSIFLITKRGPGSNPPAYWGVSVWCCMFSTRLCGFCHRCECECDYLSLCISSVINRWPVQGVPSLPSRVSWDKLQHPDKDKQLRKMDEWIDTSLEMLVGCSNSFGNPLHLTPFQCQIRGESVSSHFCNFTKTLIQHSHPLYTVFGHAVQRWESSNDLT